MNPMRALGCLLLIGMGWAITTGHAQGIRSKESAGYWGQQGRRLMQTGEFARAYSAFQLARSLGASGMVQQMEEARRRNINHILLQSLLAEANGLAETDPVQGLRLLDYAQRYFPDSSRISRLFGELINRPNLWPYSLNSPKIWSSPRMKYVVAAGKPSRLLACQGDTLSVRYTSKSDVQHVFFSPDERFVWLITTDGNVLLDCSQQPVREVIQQEQAVGGAVFSADSRHVLLLIRQTNRYVVQLKAIRGGKLVSTGVEHTDTVHEDFAYAPHEDHAPLFSPDGRYLYIMLEADRQTREPGGQLWNLIGDTPTLIRQFSEEDALEQVAFDPQSRWLLGANHRSPVLQLIDSQSTNGAVIRRFPNSYTDRLSTAFSPDGSWLLLSFIQPDAKPDLDSLWDLSKGTLRAHHVFQPQPGPSGGTLRVLSRFSPDGHWLLRSAPNEQTQAECWYLARSRPTRVHQFQRKTSIVNDLFSSDSRYVLSRHIESVRDTLWRLDTNGLHPLHGFQTRLRSNGVEVGLSPLSNYLITHHVGAVPDSIWSVSGERLQPLYGFRERLVLGESRFSADGRWFLSSDESGNGATLYPLSLLQALHEPLMQGSFVKARFAENGQYLLARTTDADSATVLYRNVGGQLRLVKKYRQPFLIDECRFLTHNQFLFTYHEIDGASAKNRYANYIWRLTNTGLESFVRLSEPAVRVVKTKSGAFYDGWRTARMRSGPGPVTLVDRGMVVSADGRYLLLYPIDNRPGGLYSLGKQLTPIPSFRHGQVSPWRDGIVPGRHLTIPDADFIGNHVWIKPAPDSAIVLYQLQDSQVRQIPLPKDISALAGYSPITNYAVFWFSGRSKQPELWQYRNQKWQFIQALPQPAQAINDSWYDTPHNNLISPDGRLMVLPTATNQLLLYRLGGPKPVLLITQPVSVRRFAFVTGGSADARTTGLVYDDNQQTYLLSVGQTGCRTIQLGTGMLHRPPVCQAGRLYVARQLPDDQVVVDVLEPTTGTRLARTGTRQFLDMTVLPDGTAWLMTKQGLKTLYIPAERLTWLRRSRIAPLSPGLQRKYVFE